MVSKTFVSDKLCSKGHATRYTKSPKVCAECHRSAVKKSYRADPEKWVKRVTDWQSRNVEKVAGYKRGHQAATRYGINRAEYDGLLASTHRCPLCADAFSPKQKKCLDHCHATGKIRGVICGHCNTGLGMFKDNPTTLDTAAAYLRRHQ